jgi:hypothetical protein
MMDGMPIAFAQDGSYFITVYVSTRWMSMDHPITQQFSPNDIQHQDGGRPAGRFPPVCRLSGKLPISMEINFFTPWPDFFQLSAEVSCRSDR